MCWTVEEFKYYLLEHSFTIITDQALLQWLQQMKDTNPWLM